MITVLVANVIVKDDKFLLIQETKEIAKGKYNLPAGRMEESETLVEAAVREAKEETGLDVVPERLVCVVQRKVSGQGDNLVVFNFVSRVVGGKITPSKEHPIVNYYSLEQIKEFDKEGLLRSPHIMVVLSEYQKGSSIGLDKLRII